MDNKESNSIAVIKTNVEWIMKTLDGISSELKSFPLAVDAINKRIDTLESGVQNLNDRFINRVNYTDELIIDHKLNTTFRKNTEFIIKIGTWLVPGNFALNIIFAAIYFLKDKI